MQVHTNACVLNPRAPLTPARDAPGHNGRAGLSNKMMHLCNVPDLEVPHMSLHLFRCIRVTACVSLYFTQTLWPGICSSTGWALQRALRLAPAAGSFPPTSGREGPAVAPFGRTCPGHLNRAQPKLLLLQMRLSAMLLHVAVALSLALPGAVLSRSHKGLTMEEGHGEAGVGAAGVILGAHSTGWVTGAGEDGVTTVAGALRRLTQNRRRTPVALRRCANSIKLDTEFN